MKKNSKHPWRGDVHLARQVKKQVSRKHYHCRDCEQLQPAVYSSACGWCGSLSLDEQVGWVTDPFLSAAVEGVELPGTYELKKSRELALDEVRERLLWDRGAE